VITDIFKGDSSRMSCLVLICMALIVNVLAVYWQVGSHQFLSYDDNVYVVSNPHIAGGITYNNLIWAFKSYYVANWHPITWISHSPVAILSGYTSEGG